jgi:hemerythrin superfamily protein
VDGLTSGATGTPHGIRNQTWKETIMGEAQEDRAKAAQLPEGDVIRILLEQHARIRELFADVTTAEGDHKSQAFDELRALLAVHETAEEMVLRPRADGQEWKQVADDRNQEEREANQVLADLERLDPQSDAFLTQLKTFEQAVDAHAEAEESQEFPRVLATLDTEERRKLGDRLRSVQKLAPTHPHPSVAGSPVGQALTGPFASMVDRVRDAISH